MGYFYNYGPGCMFGFGGILMIAFWVLVVWAIFAFAKGAGCGRYYHSQMIEDKSLAILKERYAKGEINKDEYEEKKADLMK